ncbi:MAG: outer membrane beta-barrel protein [Proteobacteria bacterium]|nr:outer membrane beta-barrel protein [Pseudomonadota bacterium]
MRHAPAFYLRRAALLGLVALAPLSANADDALGLYLGGGVGQANVRVDQLPSVGRSLRENHAAWTAVVGLRPISVLGAELGYTDFGRVSASYNPVPGSSIAADAHPRATTLLAVGYLPLPIPLLDVYVKAGVARLQTTVNTQIISCEVNINCPPPGNNSHTSSSDSRAAYAAGAQVKLGPVAVRAEYLRINASNGDPSLASVGLIWKF